MNTTATMTNGQAQESPRLVPANGQPMTLVEIVEHEALGYRAWGTPEGDFLAARWRDWPSSSDGPGRARPKTMRTAWRSGMPRSGTGIGTWDSMRV